MGAPVEMLVIGTEAYLRELSDDEFDALARRVRPPKSARYPAKRRQAQVPDSPANSA
jgi:hypothetical protein